MCMHFRHASTRGGHRSWHGQKADLKREGLPEEPQTASNSAITERAGKDVMVAPARHARVHKQPGIKQTRASS